MNRWQRILDWPHADEMAEKRRREGERDHEQRRKERNAWLIAGVLVVGLLVVVNMDGGESPPASSSGTTTTTTRDTSNPDEAEPLSVDQPEGVAYDDCTRAMSTAADEPGSTVAEPLIVATLSECGNAGEWMGALRQFPAAMGYRSAAVVDEISIQSACYGYETTPTCSDAAARGMLD